MGAHTEWRSDKPPEDPLRASPSTPWANTLRVNAGRRQFSLPAKGGGTSQDWNTGQTSNDPTKCLEPIALGNTYNGGMGDPLITWGDQTQT